MSSESFVTTASPLRKILSTLIAIELLLVFIYWIDALTFESFPLLHNLFNMDGEANIPAWFSSMQLFIAGMICFGNSSLTQKGERPSKLFWRIGSGFLFLLSIDEIAQIHERITAFVGARYIDWLPSYLETHKIIFVFLFLIMFFVMRFFYADLNALRRWSPSFSALALLGIFISFIGGFVFESLGYLLLNGEPTSLWYKIEVSAEEFFEMLGVSIFLSVSLLYHLTQLRYNETSFYKINQVVSAAAPSANFSSTSS